MNEAESVASGPGGAPSLDRTLGRLLSRLAHEIRNPLSSLDVHVQLLDEDLAATAPELRERFSSRFAIIQGELRRLETLVRQFLKLADPACPDRAPMDLRGVIEQAVQLMRPEAERRAIDLRVDLPADELAITADSGQLMQALLNLVINAIQAVGENGWIELRARGDGSEVEIVLEDTGPGVPVEEREAVFEPYFTTRTDGTGIGLWIARQIILGHGGRIRVETGRAGGALFRVNIPREPGKPGGTRKAAGPL